MQNGARPLWLETNLDRIIRIYPDDRAFIAAYLIEPQTLPPMRESTDVEVRRHFLVNSLTTYLRCLEPNVEERAKLAEFAVRAEGSDG